MGIAVGTRTHVDTHDGSIPRASAGPRRFLASFHLIYKSDIMTYHTNSRLAQMRGIFNIPMFSKVTLFLSKGSKFQPFTHRTSRPAGGSLVLTILSEHTTTHTNTNVAMKRKPGESMPAIGQEKLVAKALCSTRGKGKRGRRGGRLDPTRVLWREVLTQSSIAAKCCN